MGTRILFVCHGNICRSPMAEFLMRHMLDERGLSDEVEVRSAATTNEEIGNPPHWATAQKLSEMGISCEGKRARRIEKGDYDAFDMIVGMDEENMRDLRRAFRDDPDGKIYKMMEFAGANRDVADPWYTHDFDRTFDDIQDACLGLIAWLGY